MVESSRKRTHYHSYCDGQFEMQETGCCVNEPCLKKMKEKDEEIVTLGYSRVCHIIDCTEIFIETPSDPALKAATWSDYKHHNTAHVLLSITPNGAFNLISEA